jgi:hypothetical protein
VTIGANESNRARGTHWSPGTPDHAPGGLTARGFGGMV